MSHPQFRNIRLIVISFEVVQTQEKLSWNRPQRRLRGRVWSLHWFLGLFLCIVRLL